VDRSYSKALEEQVKKMLPSRVATEHGQLIAHRNVWYLNYIAGVAFIGSRKDSLAADLDEGRASITGSGTPQSGSKDAQVDRSELTSRSFAGGASLIGPEVGRDSNPPLPRVHNDLGKHSFSRPPDAFSLFRSKRLAQINARDAALGTSLYNRGQITRRLGDEWKTMTPVRLRFMSCSPQTMVLTRCPDGKTTLRLS
jgi:hypothetical protein